MTPTGRRIESARICSCPRGPKTRPNGATQTDRGPFFGPPRPIPGPNLGHRCVGRGRERSAFVSCPSTSLARKSDHSPAQPPPPLSPLSPPPRRRSLDLALQAIPATPSAAPLPRRHCSSFLTSTAGESCGHLCSQRPRHTRRPQGVRPLAPARTQVRTRPWIARMSGTTGTTSCTTRHHRTIPPTMRVTAWLPPSSSTST